MNLLFEFSHPKHYYQYRALIKRYEREGHNIRFLARDKDVLLELLRSEGYDYEILGVHKKGIFGKLLAIPSLIINYIKVSLKFKPDYILSKASPYAVFARLVRKVRTVITPDSEVVELTKKFVAPLSNLIITPDNYQINHGSKHLKLQGFFEELYLSPLGFTPNQKIVEEYGIDLGKPYFILRFVGWDANHDLGQFGFSDFQKIELVRQLEIVGSVYISAETRNAPKEIQDRILKIDPKHIHQVLHFASGYIGDSQTMATESSLLGTPSIRYNSFVGPNDMSNFRVLENDHHLLMNFRDFDKVKNAIQTVFKDQNSKSNWLNKRKEYFASKPDVNDQFYQHLGIKADSK